MSEALLLAIEAGDGEGRLLLADWLEERGDARAQIIRRIDAGDLSVVGPPNSQTVRQAALASDQWRLYAADVAESVLAIWERRYPDDARPRKAIEAARSGGAAYAAYAAAYAAADAAAGAAYAAYAAAAADAAAYAADAAYAAADAAAYAADAAYAAADAADAAAAARGRQWQWNLRRLADYRWFGGRKIFT